MGEAEGFPLEQKRGRRAVRWAVMVQIGAQ